MLRVGAVAQGYGDVAQQAATFRALDGALAEALAETLAIELGKVLE